MPFKTWAVISTKYSFSTKNVPTSIDNLYNKM